jgi:hypothetical protein
MPRAVVRIQGGGVTKYFFVASLCVPLLLAVTHLVATLGTRSLLSSRWVRARRRRGCCASKGKRQARRLPWERLAGMLCGSGVAFYAFVNFRALLVAPGVEHSGLRLAAAWTFGTVPLALAMYCLCIYTGDLLDISRLRGSPVRGHVAVFVMAVIGTWLPALLFMRGLP